MGASGRITQRGLGRATLERQMLLERADVDVVGAVERLVGLQAQAPNPPYVGLWTRVAGFRFEQLTERLGDRTIVRSSALRGTLHLLTADDYVGIRTLLQPIHERYLLATYRRHLDGVDPAEVAEFGRRLLAAEPRDNGELAAHLAERWPDRDVHALTSCVRFLLPLIHVPPAGTWGHHKSARLAPVETWLGRPLAGDGNRDGDNHGDQLDELVARYLAAFGPATANDVLAWSGLSRIGEVRGAHDRLGGRLVRLTTDDGSGRELLDLADAPRPDPDTVAPVRLLPEFDNVLIGYADRTRIISDEHRKTVFTKNGQIRATILVDGVVQGMWKIERHRSAATVSVQPFTELTPATRDAVAAEALAILPRTDPNADHDVVFQDT